MINLIIFVPIHSVAIPNESNNTLELPSEMVQFAQSLINVEYGQVPECFTIDKFERLLSYAKYNDYAKYAIKTFLNKVPAIPFPEYNDIYESDLDNATADSNGNSDLSQPNEAIKDNRKNFIIKTTNPFIDVNESDWFYESVTFAYHSGLINGKSTTIFSPESNLTYAEAVKLASCIHQLYTTGKVTLSIGNLWYQSYVDYAIMNNIIDVDFEWDNLAIRAGCMEIFANALPVEALDEINAIPIGAIADVLESHANATAIYKLYRAGIIQGINDKHHCDPSSYIKRAEIATILARMMDNALRINFTID